QPLPLHAGRPEPRALQLFAQAQLQLAGRLLRERHRRQAVDVRQAGPQDAGDPADELRRLPGAGRGFDDVRPGQVLADAAAIAFVGRLRAHSNALSASMSGNLFGTLRAMRRSSRVPHTGWKSHHRQASFRGYGASVPSSIARSMISSTCSPTRREVSVIGTGTLLNSPAAVQNQRRPSWTR